MAEDRVHIIKNVGRLPTRFQGEPTDVIEEYITTKDSNNVIHPVGFSYDEAVKLCETLKFDPDEAVIVCPDDMVVILDRSARKLPQGNTPGLAQFSEGIRTV